MGADRRVHKRFKVAVKAEVSADGGAGSGQIEDLSLGGALVRLANPPPVGGAVHLQFKAGGGLTIRLDGQVVRSAGPERVGVLFYGLDSVTKEMLSMAIEAAEAGEPIQSVEVETKYTTQIGDGGALAVVLQGFLSDTDCERLISQLNMHMRGVSQTLVILDVSGYRCCAPRAIPMLRDWFQSLSNKGFELGALVGPRSVGMAQLRRLIREVGIADQFMGFDTLEEANSFAREWGSAGKVAV